MNRRLALTLTIGLALGFCTPLGASAKTVTYCSSSGSGCFFSEMPLYNQNASSLSDLFPSGKANESMLCAPTSAAMALSAITFDGLSYYTDSWTDKNFVYKSEENRIRAFVDKMGTSKTEGTVNSADKYSNRQADIVLATGNVDDANWRTIDDSRIKELIDRHEVGILSRGAYDRSCAATAFGGYSCSYTRSSGHVIAINGTLTESGTRKTRFYDPWYAAVKEYNIVETSDPSYITVLGVKVSTDPRPFNSKTRELSHSGSSYKIIETVGGINTNG